MVRDGVEDSTMWVYPRVGDIADGFLNMSRAKFVFLILVVQAYGQLSVASQWPRLAFYQRRGTYGLETY